MEQTVPHAGRSNTPTPPPLDSEARDHLHALLRSFTDPLRLESSRHIRQRRDARHLRQSPSGRAYWNALIREARAAGHAALEAQLSAAVITEPELIPDEDAGRSSARRPDSLMLARHGVHLDAGRIVVHHRPLLPRLCHTNTAALYLGGEITSIMTGYALRTAAGVWVRHTWGMDGDELVETTVPFDRYFGLLLDNSGDTDVPRGSAPLFARQFVAS